jgi:hypothetical protein
LRRGTFLKFGGPASSADALATILFASRERTGIVVLRAETGRTDRRDHGEKLFKRHMEIQETTLAEYPSVVIENFVRDHEGKARQRRNGRKSSRIFDLGQFNSELSGNCTLYRAIIPERNHFSSGALRHEQKGLLDHLPATKTDHLYY